MFFVMLLMSTIESSDRSSWGSSQPQWNYLPDPLTETDWIAPVDSLQHIYFYDLAGSKASHFNLFAIYD